MKKITVQLITCFLMLISSTAFCQQTDSLSEWQTIYKEGASPNETKVQIQFKVNGCQSLAPLRWRFKNEFERKGAIVHYTLEYIDCNGNTTTEIDAVDISKPGIINENGYFTNGKKWTNIRDITLIDPQRDEANAQKSDLDAVAISFNQTYKTFNYNVSLITDPQKKNEYQQKVDDYKTQFKGLYQQAVQNYENGKGDMLNKNVSDLKSIHSKMKDDLNMEHDLYIGQVKMQTEQQEITLNQAIAQQNNANKQIQNSINNSAASNNNSILQTEQLAVAKLQIQNQQAHGNNSAALLQQKQQVQQMQQQQNERNATTLINSAGTIISALINNGNDKDEEKKKEEKYAYLNAHEIHADAERSTPAELDSIGFLFFLANRYQEALDYFSEAANRGYMFAYRAIGMTNGRSYLNHPEMAIKAYMTGAENGDSFCMFKLGNYYRDGYGMKKDYAKAEQWYEKSLYTDKNKHDSLKNNHNFTHKEISDYENDMKLLIEDIVKIYEQGGHGVAKSKERVEFWNKFAY